MTAFRLNPNVVDNARGMMGAMKNIPGVMQFAVLVDKDDVRYRLAEFMFYHSAMDFADETYRCGVYLRVAVERVR